MASEPEESLYYVHFAAAERILRAVGNTTLPLVFLAVTSILNIILDLAFVLGLHAGIAGVAYATILSQFISAALTLLLLTRSREIFRLTWRDLHIDRGILKRILGIGLPAAAQSVVTSISNVFVQSYVNAFGSTVMAGWSCYNKLDQFIMLPMQSMAMASTTFVSQNIGAGKERRADQGTGVALLLSTSVTLVIAVALFVFASPAVRLFSPDSDVIRYGVLFIRSNVFFLLFNCVNHVLAGALRGRGDSAGPMIIMLSCFVGVRQIYLYLITHLVANTPRLVGLGYPVGWTLCCIVELSYYFIRRRQYRTRSAV